MTALAAVLGWPIAHSKSPAIVNAAFAALGIDAHMEAWATPPDKLADTLAELRARRAIGASVTVPHKESVIALCDEVDDEARAVGAVNCLALAGAHVRGSNTDVAGFREALAAAGCTSRRAVLLGAGGAARAVHRALAGEIVVIARRPRPWIASRAWTDAELRAAFARADLVVDCTSAGLDPATDRELADALPLDALPAGASVATLVYHRATRLLERARDRGLRVLDGRAMLVRQAAHAIERWTGRSAPIGIMTRTLDDALRP